MTPNERVRPGGIPETLAGLRPAFADPVFAQRIPQVDWSVTAGNSSPLDDGASAVLITFGEIAAWSWGERLWNVRFCSPYS
ncbi:MAG TPA: hypothetical protein VGP70_02435 [Actinomadura sp.]|nr:hypothetical protein [Actinomadura sp.]